MIDTSLEQLMDQRNVADLPIEQSSFLHFQSNQSLKQQCLLIPAFSPLLSLLDSSGSALERTLVIDLIALPFNSFPLISKQNFSNFLPSGKHPSQPKG
jgi:hypothetical protein